MSKISLANLKIKSWRENPCQFVYDNFKVNMDPWQEDVFKSLAENKTRNRLAMKACTGPGKSAVLSWIGWFRLSCFADRGEHPKGAALSGEGRDNLRDNLWSELSKWQKRSEFLTAAFSWSKEQIVSNDHKETWFLSARSYAKDADPEEIGRSLSGLHSKFPFVLLDETGGMPIAVGKKAEQIFTGGCVNGLVAQAGNPTSTDGLLYDSCVNNRELTTVVTITADPDDPKRTSRVDKDHAAEMIKKHGRSNPWVMATILGEFPDGSMNTLLSLKEVEDSMKRGLREQDYSFAQKRLGVDVARFGDDRTVLFPRQGLRSFKPVEIRNARTNEIAARVVQAKAKWGSEMEFVDDTGGYGSGVVDSLLQAGVTATPVNFASKAIDPRYLNKRAEIWFNMAEWIKRGGCLPDIPELVRELTAPTYYFQNGKFQIEPKEQIKERLGASPDLADALALTFALPEMPSSQTLFSIPGVKKNFKSEYDPFATKD